MTAVHSSFAYKAAISVVREKNRKLYSLSIIEPGGLTALRTENNAKDGRHFHNETFCSQLIQNYDKKT